MTDDDHFQLVERAFVEGAEDVAAARIDAPRGVFLPYELREVGAVGFFEFGSEQLFPVGGDLYIHVARCVKAVSYTHLKIEKANILELKQVG